MDYFKTIKTCLESEGCLQVLKNMNLEVDMILEAAVDSNLCCANNSFLFVYLEKATSFLALSFNRLCKTNDKSVASSIQRLSVNGLPVGRFKKCLMNSAGTYILVVYDKCLSVVEIPSKWGKYDQYNGGSLITMCKSNKLPHTADIMDAIWHTRADYNRIVCLTKDNFIRIFNCENLKTPIKEYHLQSIYHEENIPRSYDNSLQTCNIDMGNKFSFNGKPAYPIYVQKSAGQIECILDCDSKRNFEVLGELRLCPTSEVLDDPQVASFMCLPTFPNCLVILMRNFTIYHCLFMPKTREFSNEDDQSYEENAEFNDEAVLYIYESINLDASKKIENIKFIKDPSHSARYFIMHESGVHSVHMPWLERLQVSYLNQNNQNTIDFDQLKFCDLNHLISTQPFIEKTSGSFIIGLTVLHGFGNTNATLIGLNNQGGFVCINVQMISELDEARNRILSTVDAPESKCEVATDEFASYISSILKRKINLPILSASNMKDLSEKELNLFMKQIINLLQFEYIEKQKLVMVEFQKRSKLLKQQEQLQFEIVKEINAKNETLNKRKQEISTKYEEYNQKQEKLKNNIGDCFDKLLEKVPVPMNDSEKEIKRDLTSIKSQLEIYEFEIKKNQQVVKSSELGLKPESSIDPSEMNNLRSLIKNENDKIKQLVQKVEKLKVAVKI